MRVTFRDACTRLEDALQEVQHLRNKVHAADKTARTLSAANEVLRERLAEMGVRSGADVEGTDEWQGENSRLKGEVANKEKECTKIMSQLRQVSFKTRIVLVISCYIVIMGLKSSIALPFRLALFSAVPHGSGK
jgi:hypothetical protein